jgi:hypothetical protein
MATHAPLLRVNQTQLNKGLSSAMVSLCMFMYNTVSVHCPRYQQMLDADDVASQSGIPTADIGF